jgi:hypothetical protein
MKIAVVKKGSKVTTMHVCPWVVDVPPETKK